MIVIKDMKMPNCCATCHISEVDCKYKKTAFVRYSKDDFARPSDCPLIEIITCKDCKYTRQNDDNDRYCDLSGGYYDPDYYCAYAERRK